MTEKIKKEVVSLQQGEKKLFLLGTVFHETRLYIENMGDGTLRFAYFDPADPGTIKHSYLINRQEIQNKEVILFCQQLDKREDKWTLPSLQLSELINV